MAIELGIVAFNDSEPIDFSEANIHHANCGIAENQKISLKRNPATNSYMLKCICGLEVTFDQLGKAELTMSKCALGDSEATLPDDSMIQIPKGQLWLEHFKNSELGPSLSSNNIKKSKL